MSNNFKNYFLPDNIKNEADLRKNIFSNEEIQCFFVKSINRKEKTFKRCCNDRLFNAKHGIYLKVCEYHKEKYNYLKPNVCSYPGCNESIQLNAGFKFCHAHDSEERKQTRRYQLNGKQNICKHCGVQEEHVTARSKNACRLCYPHYNTCYVNGCNNPGNYYRRQGCCNQHGILTTIQKNAIKSGKLLNIIKAVD